MKEIKSHTDIPQSMKLAKILSSESADMCYIKHASSYNPNWEFNEDFPPMILGNVPIDEVTAETLPCWSLAALLSIIKDKCGYFEFVYLKRTSDGRANPLEDVYRLSTDVYDVYNKEAIDACYEMILKLHELKML